MSFPMPVVCHAIKESAGEMEGRAFDSLTFHCEVELKENGAGRSIGKVTRPFKIKGAAKDFDKWLRLGASAFPLDCVGTFDIHAVREDKSELVLVDIVPARAASQAQKAA